MRLEIDNSDIPVLCRACEARHGGICGALDPAELLRLGKMTSRQRYPARTILLTPGEHTEYCSNILNGVVKVSKLLPDGRQQVVELQFAPDFLGHPFAAESNVFIETASAVELCSFPRHMLKSMTAESAALQNRLHRQVLRQLDQARDWMMTLGQKTAAEKVASFLIMLAGHLHPSEADRSKSFDLTLSRMDIADFLGLTTETVSRQLTALRKAGVIHIDKARHVSIINPQGLRAAAAQ
ncbi:Crp/Fnr family transcriptional regulator [Sulfitobacter aestuarii]|uniref:Crp/Fnr family transcriptional regulator n=1 Tax=Sulfitobacter aestuarii TaxID=2161676 RepID=A0ABW5U854_9RHOB